MGADREKIHISIPIDAIGLHVRISHHDVIAASLLTSNFTKAHIQTLTSTVKSLQDAEEKRKEAELKQKQNRLRLMVVNNMIYLARQLCAQCQPNYVDSPDTTKIQQFAATVTDKQLTKMKVPEQLWKQLRRLKTDIPKRNAAAHESKDDFASLITSDDFATTIYPRFDKLFPYLYNDSAENIAKNRKDEWDFGIKFE